MEKTFCDVCNGEIPEEHEVIDVVYRIGDEIVESLEVHSHCAEDIAVKFATIIHDIRRENTKRFEEE